jgi:YD repeat-containing protein
MQVVSTNHVESHFQAMSGSTYALLLCVCAFLLGQAALAQTPPTRQWLQSGYGGGWHAVPTASGAAKASTTRSQARRPTPSSGVHADATGGSVASTYSFFAVPGNTNPSVLWFDEHMCCQLQNSDIVPATFIVTSSCSQVGLFFGGTLTRTADDIAYAENSLWPSENLSPPYATVDWFWGNWLTLATPIEKTLSCTFTASRDGSQVANITLTWNPPPETNLGPSSCSDGGCSGAGPIDFNSGNVYIQQNDLTIPGLNGGLKIVRTWNSLSGLRGPDNNGAFGNGWTSNYEERVEVSDGGQVKYRRGDGSAWTFQPDPSQVGLYRMAAPANHVATLQSGLLSWTLTFQNGERRFFDNASGWMNAFQDRNRNTTSVTHDSWGRITKVTDPASRHLYFHYDDRGFQQQVTSVTSDAGTTVSYSYGDYPLTPTDYVLLNQVIYPDQSAVWFDYDGDSRALVLNVWDSPTVDGARTLLETHTYDAVRRGLTSARANGVEAITVTYPPATP